MSVQFIKSCYLFKNDMPYNISNMYYDLFNNDYRSINTQYYTNCMPKQRQYNYNCTQANVNNYNNYYDCTADTPYTFQSINNSRAASVNLHYGSPCYTVFPSPNPVTRTTSVVSYSSTSTSGYVTDANGNVVSYNPTTTTTTPQGSAKYNIAVIDFCDDSDADIDLDGDGVGDMAHGNVVAHLIDTFVENANVHTFDITENSQYTSNQRIIASLESVLGELKSNPNAYDALNMSLSSRITYSDLSKILGVTVNNDNVDVYQDAIRNWLLNKGEKEGFPTTAKVVKLLEEIASYGVDIYIAAANVNDDSDDELNLYSIAKNTTTVGANNTSGSRADFSFNNSLIDTWTLGEIEVKKVKNASGQLLGYDLNGDGVADIDGKYTSGGSSVNPFLKGTSFASPYKLSSSLA